MGGLSLVDEIPPSLFAVQVASQTRMSWKEAQTWDVAMFAQKWAMKYAVHPVVVCSLVKNVPLCEQQG
jgi:hypothetical protein